MKKKKEKPIIVVKRFRISCKHRYFAGLKDPVVRIRVDVGAVEGWHNHSTMVARVLSSWLRTRWYPDVEQVPGAAMTGVRLTKQRGGRFEGVYYRTKFVVEDLALIGTPA